MSQPLRLLLVEDAEDDALLVLRALRAGGFQPETKRLETAEAMTLALATGTWDIVISDYAMPKFSGSQALALVRASGLDLPFIVVSGTIGEDVAVAMMKTGAHDYIMKGHLARLAPAVQRELQEAEQRRQRRQAEQALRESEERFRELAERSSEGFWFAALEPESILYVSPAMERIWGLPAQRFYENHRAKVSAIDPADHPRVQHAWEECVEGRSPHYEAEYRVIQPDGSVRWVLDSGTPIRNEAGALVRVGGMARDITERKQMDMQMLRTQRLEAIGTLAGGVAHDLNNVLAPILMGVEFLKVKHPDAASILNLFETSASRGAGIVRQLLTFAKGGWTEQVSIQTSHLITELKDLMQGTFPKNIELRANYEPGLPTVLGDATQLHQVLLNLCINARDAMPSGGKLEMDARVIDVDATYAIGLSDARPGKYVALRVSDTGTGIPPEILDRIFDPFFTTKGPENGTGLGLSTVIGIVKGLKGFLRVDSKPGLGTTFTVHLPAENSGSQGMQAVTTKSDFRGQGETILLVDDDPAMLETGRMVLTELNLNVLTAADGTEGLLSVIEHRDRLRVIITDLHMPHMDGLAFIRAVRRVLPDIAVIVGSGRMDDARSKDFEALGVAHHLAKPYTQDILTAMLAKLLGDTKRPGGD